MQQKITPNLWFDTEAEEAAGFYTSVFKNSRIVNVTHYTEGGPRPAGTVMTVEFELDGQRFVGINGGPEFTFDEAVSFEINCETQDEIDYYWDRLSEGGEEGPCGWLKDRYRPVLAGRTDRHGGVVRSIRTRSGPSARCRRCSG